MTERNLLKSQRVIGSVVDVMAKHQTRALGRAIPGVRSPLNWNVVRVKNSTGVPVAMGNVLQLGAFDLDAIDRHDFFFDGQLPAGVGSTKHFRFVVAAEDIPEDEGYGRCYCMGVCVAKVDIQATSDTHGMAAGGLSFLGGDSGPCEILSPLDGLGEQLCVVRIGSSGCNFLQGKVDADAAVDSTATVSVWSGGQGAMADTTRNVSASTWFGAVTAGMKVAMLHDAVTGWLIVSKGW